MATFESPIDGETAIALLFLCVGTYMFAESYKFPHEVALFPRFVTSILILGSVLLLSGDYLPSFLQPLVGGAGQDSSTSAERFVDADQTSASADSNDTMRVSYGSFQLNKGVFTAATCAIYIVLSYLIGMYYATPIFVMSYLYFTGKSRRAIFVFGIVGLGIAHAFMTVLDVQMMNGVLLP